MDGLEKNHGGKSGESGIFPADVLWWVRKTKKGRQGYEDAETDKWSGEGDNGQFHPSALICGGLF